MKIGIVGPGALGSFLAGILGKKNKVILFGKKDLNIKHIKIMGETELITEIQYTTDTHDLSNMDYIIICTKSYDTREAMEDIIGSINNKTIIVSLQNGLNNEKIISEYVGEDRVIGGITGNGITFLDYGKMIHAGKGETIIGAFSDEIIEKTYNFSKILKESGLENKFTNNIYGHIWKKVIINASINPITALTRNKNGAILENKGLFELMKKICLEGKKVAMKEVNLPEKDLIKATKDVAKLTSKNKSSMLQDVENKRRTEIDCINSAIVKKGEKFGIKTPCNKIIVNLVKGLESSYL